MKREKMRTNRRKRKSIRKDKRAFTGLEAAIVLTAFVVVAAVFSYVVLNAGFFTTQKAKSTIHTGMEQATSSVELAGDVIGYGTGRETTSKLDNVTFYVRLTAGQNPVDLNETIVTYTASTEHILLSKNFSVCGNATSLSGSMPGTDNEWSFGWLGDADGDNLLERGEKAEIFVNPVNLDPNDEFTIEVKPPEGTTLGIERTVPAAIYEVINLL
jgi:flagellin FlaB